MHDDIEMLYKYRSLSGENRDFVKRIILESEIFFPSPVNFNDPFDCKVQLSMNGNDYDWELFIQRLYREQNPHSPALEIETLARKTIAEGKHRYLANNVDLTQVAVEPIGVLCLSSKADQILMWSHYADSHRGIAIGFEATSRTPFFGRAEPVIYSEQYPNVDLLSMDLEDTAIPILFTKSNHWEYEAEWRVVEHEGGYGTYKFPPELLKSIILGCNITIEDKEMVMHWMSERAFQPKLYQASKKLSEFGIDIIEINPGTGKYINL